MVNIFPRSHHFPPEHKKSVRGFQYQKLSRFMYMTIRCNPMRCYNVEAAWQHTVSTVIWVVVHKNVPFWETTTWLFLCWHHMSHDSVAVIIAVLWDEPPICIQNVTRHRWQAVCDGGHQQGRLLLCACRTPNTPTPVRQRFGVLVSVS